jgi:iron complex outermembrane receptor protein
LICGVARAADPPPRVSASPAAAARRASPAGLQEPAPVGTAPDVSANQKSADDLLDLPLERLAAQSVVVPALQQVVNTVSRQESTVGKSPAAVFVITNEMIHRNGATSIPEALRMAPGLSVARIDSNKWAVSARGFNDRFANKLLVQIDERVVYN